MTDETARLMAELDALMAAALEEQIAADSAVPDDAPADVQLDPVDPPVWLPNWKAEAERARDRFEVRNVRTNS